MNSTSPKNVPSRAIYRGDFTDWASVSAAFAPDDYYWSRKTRAPIPEPEEVILAEYEAAGYEGDAFVVYRNGDKFYTVEAGHCSCHGLEDQWEPEEYDRATLIEAMRRRAKDTYDVAGKAAQEIIAVLLTK